MHVTSEPNILYFGTPVVVISTVNEDGSYNLAPMSSVFWLGWRALRVRRSDDAAAGTAVRRPLLHGAIFGLTNPKAYPVAIATFTALLSAKASLLTWSMLPVLVVASCVGGLLAYAILVAVVGTDAVRRSYRRHEILITRASGVLFMGFAAHALLHAAPGLLPRRPT